MANRCLSVIIALLVAVTCSVHSEETAHDTGLRSADDMSSNGDHQTQKRMILNNPAEEDESELLADEGLVGSSLPADYSDKRSSLFRFGKRQRSPFRFGKRGSIFRFGKRQGGTLFRFGKRAGALFRFGRSGSPNFPSEQTEEDEILSSNKQYDVDLLRYLLAQYELANSPSYLEGAESKRGIDSFHWGSEK